MKQRRRDLQSQSFKTLFLFWFLILILFKLSISIFLIQEFSYCGNWLEWEDIEDIEDIEPLESYERYEDHDDDDDDDCDDDIVDINDIENGGRFDNFDGLKEESSVYYDDNKYRYQDIDKRLLFGFIFIFIISIFFVSLNGTPMFNVEELNQLKNGPYTLENYEKVKDILIEKARIRK